MLNTLFYMGYGPFMHKIDFRHKLGASPRVAALLRLSCCQVELTHWQSMSTQYSYIFYDHDIDERNSPHEKALLAVAALRPRVLTRPSLPMSLGHSARRICNSVAIEQLLLLRDWCVKNV